MRLRRVRSRTEGWTRRRSGKGWTYLDADGQPITGAERERIEALAIPPAWSEVWICPFENGHLQATGIDDAGRTQYRYHPDWTRRRNLAKFDRVLEVAAVLPDLRRQVAADLARTDRSRDHAAALAVRLLDTGAFRVGNDAYARQGSFGLTTLERRHVRAEGAGVVVKFVGKSGVEHRVLVDDPEAVAALNRMRRRRPGGPGCWSTAVPTDRSRWTPATSTTTSARSPGWRSRPRICGPGPAPCSPRRAWPPPRSRVRARHPATARCDRR